MQVLSPINGGAVIDKNIFDRKRYHQYYFILHCDWQSHSIPNILKLFQL